MKLLIGSQEYILNNYQRGGFKVLYRTVLKQSQQHKNGYTNHGHPNVDYFVAVKNHVI